MSVIRYQSTRRGVRPVGGSDAVRDVVDTVHAATDGKRLRLKGRGRAGSASMSTTFRGATAARVLATNPARVWRAPSGGRTGGTPNTDVRLALRVGRDRSADITATDGSTSLPGKCGSDALAAQAARDRIRAMPNGDAYLKQVEGR